MIFHFFRNESVGNPKEIVYLCFLCMKRITVILLLCVMALSAFAEMPYRTILRKADDHFVNREWREAIPLYDLLLKRKPERIKSYVDAVVSSAMVEDSALVMRYVVQSEKQGLSLDSLFTGIAAGSRSVGNSAVYERVLLLVKREQPWFTRVANNYLLQHYLFRHDAERVLAIADELLAVAPAQINYLKAKADALLWQGKDSAVVEVQRAILQIDSLNFDANLFLGSYYAMRGKNKLAEINARYIETGERNAEESLVYKQEKRAVLDSDIAQAKNYFTCASQTRKNKYLTAQLAELSSLTDELPHQSGEGPLPFLKRLKQE